MVDLLKIEQTLRSEVRRIEVTWPKADIHNPEIPKPVRVHTKTQHERAGEIQTAAEIIAVISKNPPLWRFLIGLPVSRLQEIMNAELEREQVSR